MSDKYLSKEERQALRNQLTHGNLMKTYKAFVDHVEEADEMLAAKDAEIRDLKRKVLATEMRASQSAEMDALTLQHIENQKAEIARLRTALKPLLDAMDTCHVCKGNVLVEDGPIHCLDCSSDCESHEEPACSKISELHAVARAALEGKHG